LKTFLYKAAAPAYAVYKRVVARLFFQQLIKRTGNFGHLNWMGQPIWQNVLDLWNIQEVICRIKPRLLIETGTHRGGSAYFYGSLFDLLGQGKVISVDVTNIHDISHPRVEFLTASSVSPDTVARMQSEVAKCGGPVLIILDSDHSEAHVLRELEVYGPMVTPGSYVLVQDGVIDELTLFKEGRPGPVPAIQKYLRNHPEFEIDTNLCERFIISHHPIGWLRRKA